MTPRPNVAPAAVLGVGFTFSLAANLLWCWPGGPVRILGGALASIALPAALHLFPKVGVKDGWVWRWLRALVVAAIAVLAAYTTYRHASALLIVHGEDVLLASLYPIMTELLVVMGVLACWVPGKVRSTNVARSSTSSAAQPAAPNSGVTSKREAARAWARVNWREDLRPMDIRAGLLAGSVSIDKTTASRAYKSVADEFAA